MRSRTFLIALSGIFCAIAVLRLYKYGNVVYNLINIKEQSKCL